MSKINHISYWLFLVLPSALFFEKIVASTLIAVLFLIKIPIIFQFKTLKLLLKQKILLFSILYFLLHAIALLFTIDIEDGLYSLEIILSFLVLPLIGITFKRNNKPLQINRHFVEKLFYVFVSVGFLAIALCLCNAFYKVNFGNGSKDYWFFYRGLAHPLWQIHPIYLAYYLNFLLSILLFHDWNLKWKFREYIKWILILLTIIFLILLSARTPLVVSFIILILFIYHRLKVYKVALALTTLSLLITSVLALVFTNNRFKELFNENGILQEDRVQTWRGAYEVASDHFWFGIPKGDLDDELEKVYRKNNHTKGLERSYNCHNQYLQLLCYFGIFGLLYFILWLYYVYRATIDNHLIFQLLVFSILIYFCTESIMSVNKGIVFISYFFTLIAIYEK